MGIIIITMSIYGNNYYNNDNIIQRINIQRNIIINRIEYNNKVV